MQYWRPYVEIAISLFVIANPIGAIPVFISLTISEPEQVRRRTAKIAAATVAIVFVISVFVGQPLLNFFGVSFPSFRVGGGILILLMAIAMLQVRPNRVHSTPEETKEAEAKEDIGVVPIGIPLVAGPGAISTMIIYANQAKAGSISFVLSSWESSSLFRHGSRSDWPTQSVTGPGSTS
jgi:multiple antibiotic resistance protein